MITSYPPPLLLTIGVFTKWSWEEHIKVLWYVCTAALLIFSWHRMHSVVDFPCDNDNSNLAHFWLAWYLIQLVFKGPTNMPMKQWILIIILHKGISIEKSTYRGICNESFWNKLSAILWRDSVRFGKNFSDGAILEVILLELRSKSSHLGRREGGYQKLQWVDSWQGKLGQSNYRLQQGFHVSALHLFEGGMVGLQTE